MDAATFRKLGHRLVDQVAGLLESVPLGPVNRDESPSAVRDALGLTGPLPESGTDPGELLEQTRATAVRSFAFQRAPALFRIHHGASGADRDSRRLSRGGRESERRRLDAVAGRH